MKGKGENMNNLKKYVLFLALCSMALFTSCDDDNESVPQFGTINITINVSNAGDWPADGTVFCSLDKTWPPSGAPYKSVTLTSSQVSSGSISLTFEGLDFDTYALLSMSWRDPNDPNPQTNQHVWATHSGSPQAFWMDAAPITISPDNAELDMVLNATIN